MLQKMDRTYLLIDAAPGMEERVYDELATIPQVTARRLVRQGNVDVVAVLETSDIGRTEATVGNSIRFMLGVRNVTEVHDTEIEDLPFMVREALADFR